jgi:hypothetical protein
MYLTTPAPTSYGRPASLGEVIEAIGLGVAIFQTGQSILTSGDFTSESSTVNYIHERTPISQVFRTCSMEFSLKAHHPRYGIGDQTFWFRLSFEYNGNDIRNAAINALVNRSSSLYSSTFSIRFAGQPHSVPSAAVAEVMFQIGGRWNPVGRGDISFSGNLRLRADGNVTLAVSSERNWVWVGTPPSACTRMTPAPEPAPARDVVLPIPFFIFFSPPGSDRVREGDEQRLARWILGLAPAIRDSITRGQSPIRVDGFASTTQPGSANRELSRRRAQRVAQILRDLLGAGARIEIRAMGEYTAGTPDRVESERERRVQITILYTTRIGGRGP